MTENLPNISQSAAYALSEIAKEGYQDLAKPGVQNIGKTIGSGTRLLHAIFGRPLDSVSKQIEDFFDSVDAGVRDRAKYIPPSERIEPSLGFTKAIYDGILSAEGNKTLEELFVNLISSSMDKRYSKGLLLVYPEILKQITSDEAKILTSLYQEPDHITPIINILNKPKKQNSGPTIVYNKVSKLIFDRKYQFIHNINQYIDNLTRLNIVEVNMLKQFTDDQKYENLINKPEIKSIKDAIESNEDRTIQIEKGILQLTSLGVGFCKACKISEISQSN